VELFHGGAPFEAARILARAEAPAQFPLADLAQAESWARAYCCDPRNLDGSVLAGSCELQVRVALAPSPDDPTGQPVWLAGHVDQLRRGSDGVLRVWDLKSGRDGGVALLYAHAWQLAAYAEAAGATLGETCLVGGVVRLRGYDVRDTLPGDAPAHFTAGWSREDHLAMLAEVVDVVARVRAGVVPLLPGAHCQWCPGGSPAACRHAVARVLDAPTLTRP
jgi:hypothetical protein